MPKELIVVKSNDFIEASYKLTLDETRVLLLTLGVLDPDKPKRLFEFTVSDFAKRFGIDEKIAYQQVSKAVDKLGGRWAVIEKTKKVERKVTFLTEQAYFQGEGRFQIILHEKLMPYISKLKGRFTKYNLDYVVNFNGFHSIRLYELMAQYRIGGEREISLTDLKDWLQVADKYPRYNNFKQWVIEPSVNEINNKSDLNITYEPIKQGRKIHGLKFTIKAKKQHQTTNKIDIKLPNRPQVLKGSDAEGKWARECIRVIKKFYQDNKIELQNYRLEHLTKLVNYYTILGDTFARDDVKKVIEYREKQLDLVDQIN